MVGLSSGQLSIVTFVTKMHDEVMQILTRIQTWRTTHLPTILSGMEIPYAKKCACNMHVTTNYMHVMVNMHVTLLLHECYMHVVRVLEMVAHVPCMLYEC